jgi:hypothetical protein
VRKAVRGRCEGGPVGKLYIGPMGPEQNRCHEGPTMRRVGNECWRKYPFTANRVAGATGPGVIRWNVSSELQRGGCKRVPLRLN